MTEEIPACAQFDYYVNFSDKQSLQYRLLDYVY